jgi:acetyl-CoA carboxylase biotin carboxyl carrier protein
MEARPTGPSFTNKIKCMTISDKALLQVLKLLEESDSLALEVESGDLRLTARKGNAAVISHAAIAGDNTARQSVPATETSAPVATEVPAAALPEASEVAATEGVVIVRSPMKGTFYRAPAPGEPPFCDAGDRVAADDTVCLVEIMKLFNSIPASASGTVEKFFVENAEPVDLHQAIVSIKID